MFRFSSFLLIVLLLPLTSSGWDDSDWNSGYDAGKTAGTAFAKKVDEPEEINTRFIQPLISSGTLMQNFNGSLSFDGQLSAPSSDAFLEIMVAPAGTGDLTTVLLRQDTDFDGTPDFVYTLPVRTSGICANGFISADAGSWNNLHYYTWETNPAGQVTIAEQSSILDLTACYCINTSCGSNLVWSNLDIVLRDIGTGVVSAVQKNRPEYTITDVDIVDTTITYYGQESQNTGAAGDVYAGGTTHPEIYANIPEGITGAGEAEFNNQISDTDSYAYLVSNASDKTTNTLNCVIWNDVQFDQENFNISNSGIDHWGTDHFLYIRIVKQDNNFLYQWLNTGPENGSVCKNGCGPCSWATVGAIDTDSILFPDSSSYSYSFSADMGGWGCSNGSANINSLNGETQFSGVCGEDGCQQPSVNWTYSLSGIYDNPKLVFNNTCGNIDNSCSLVEEKICSRGGGNCIYTVKNFISTGFTPYPFCESVSTSIDSYTVCMDGSQATIVNSSNTSTVLASGNTLWWRVERTYLCEELNTFNFDDAQTRMNQIKSTIKDNNSALGYQDINTDTGQLTSDNIGLPG